MQVSPDGSIVYFNVMSGNVSPYIPQGVYQYGIETKQLTQLKPPGAISKTSENPAGVQMQGYYSPSALAIFNDGNKIATQGVIQSMNAYYHTPSDLIYYYVDKNSVSGTYIHNLWRFCVH